MWSLDANCKKEDVEKGLAAIGFYPEHLIKLDCSAFGLAFDDGYSGCAFSLALDFIAPNKVNLKYNGEGIRAAPWPPKDSKDSRSSLYPWDMPKGLEDSMAVFAEQVKT